MVAHVALTCDFWTLRASDAYLGVTAHYITPTWELKSRSLQAREVKERHTADNVRNAYSRGGRVGLTRESCCHLTR